MRTTRVVVLATVAVVAAAVGWAGARVLTSVNHVTPRASAGAPWALLFLVALLVGGAVFMRRRVQVSDDQRPRPPVNPDTAVRLLVLAKASALVGAAVTGLYVGLAIFHVGALDVPARRDATFASLITAAIGVVVVCCALWLERECRTPDDHDPTPSPSG